MDFTFAAIAFISIALIFLAHEDPFARTAVCSKISICPSLGTRAWYKILYDLSVGSLTTLVFYYLVVRLPEYERRQRLKRSFAAHYQRFRKDCVGIMLAVAHSPYTHEDRERLVDQKAFREYFNQKSSPSTDRWHDFLNNLDEYYLQRLLINLEILREEITFVLNNTDLADDKVFEFLKRLSNAIVAIRTTELGYDETKPLERLLYEMFAGFDFVHGCRDNDLVQDMIDAI